MLLVVQSLMLSMSMSTLDLFLLRVLGREEARREDMIGGREKEEGGNEGRRERGRAVLTFLNFSVTSIREGGDAGRRRRRRDEGEDGREGEREARGDAGIEGGRQGEMRG